ncbi:NUDIX hydrolase [Paenibacillus herberti]|uniref:8-oxo-dGTP diphosphatase n=1 Tax=Paenibacillus herberti TaxID=1619309 RepID=A0A229P5Y9_9BACL|nr:NUDIX domain-containing protein [Paenibacillus herberti]OXM17269.1 NUDIX hydrolase [Paenibacillus herberti]
MNRFSLHCAVNLILLQGKKVLLLQRKQTGFSDGLFGVAGGHVEGKEPAKSALIREVQEEINIQLAPKQLDLVVSVHRKLEHSEYIDLFFTSDSWSGDLRNNEPHKHNCYAWYPINDLPRETMPLVQDAIQSYLKGINYFEMGWDF